MKLSKNEEGSKIPFINVLKYIECGETANVTINGIKFNISVNKNDENYYIENESFKDREEFINGLYNKTSVLLSENSTIIINSIADENVKIDSGWKFEDIDKNFVNVETNKKYKLYRNIVIRLIVLYVFIITISYMIFKEISTYANNGLYVTLLWIKEIPGIMPRTELFTIKKEVIAILLIINNISIIFFKENRTRLLALFKYSRKQINEIEEKSIKYINDNIDFGVTCDISFSEENLILIKNANFKIIKYENIAYILNIRNYWHREDEGEKNICIITKNKKLVKLGDIIQIKKFKEKLLEKNPEIIFDINKNEITDVKDISINNILFKDIVTTLYKVWSKVVTIYTSIQCITGQHLLTDILTARHTYRFYIR